MGSYLAFAMMSQLCYWYSMLEEYVPSAALLFKWQPKVRKKNSRRNTKDTDRDTDNTEETQRKIPRKKTSIWKHDIAFLNFLINIAFTILATFQILVLITLSTLRPWRRTTYDFQALISHSNFWFTFSCF